MASLPYIQLYVADYLADTAHLTTLEHGAYLLLIMNYWQRGKPLPKSDERLARIARLSDQEWQQVRDNILEFFAEHEGQLHHNRIDRDLAAVMEKSVKASEAGKKSAAQRSFNTRSTDVERPLNHTDTDIETDTDLKESGAPARSKPAFPALHPGRDALLSALSDEPKTVAVLRSDSPPEEYRLAADVMLRNRGQPVGLERKNWIESVRTAHQNLRGDSWYINAGGILWLLDVKKGQYNGEHSVVRVAKYQNKVENGTNGKGASHHGGYTARNAFAGDGTGWDHLIQVATD